ncbi:hypothetical protein C8R44DRAFT_880574 [Mycena epipterygia]|nr:hypothetical protein C8R44DRAFT_880574 [Mycena epipterygia]
MSSLESRFPRSHLLPEPAAKAQIRGLLRSNSHARTWGAPALELIAAHSERWQTARFVSLTPRSGGMLLFRSGETPPVAHAEFVRICLHGYFPRCATFEGGHILWFTGDHHSARQVATAPVGLPAMRRIRGTRRGDGIWCEPAMSVLPHLSKTAKFNFELCYLDGTPPFDESTFVPSVTAEIAALSIVVVKKFPHSNVGATIAKIVDSLTLPALQELKMDSEEYPSIPLLWPHSQFLALSVRSSFHTSLRSLQLSSLIITEAELLECLSGLPHLEHLTISDRQLVAKGGANQLLITDSLLAHLTSAPHSPPVIPQLCSFHCQTLLQFDDNVYLKFILSRLEDRSLFESEIWSLPDHFRELDPIVDARIQELCDRDLLVFSFFSFI